MVKNGQAMAVMGTMNSMPWHFIPCFRATETKAFDRVRTKTSAAPGNDSANEGRRTGRCPGMVSRVAAVAGFGLWTTSRTRMLGPNTDRSHPIVSQRKARIEDGFLVDAHHREIRAVRSRRDDLEGEGVALTGRSILRRQRWTQANVDSHAMVSRATYYLRRVCLAGWFDRMRCGNPERSTRCDESILPSRTTGFLRALFGCDRPRLRNLRSTWPVLTIRWPKEDFYAPTVGVVKSRLSERKFCFELSDGSSRDCEIVRRANAGVC